VRRSDRRHVTLGELIDSNAASLQTGPFGSQLHASDYMASGIPVIPTEAIGRRSIISATLPQVSEDTASRLSRHVLRSGDILFARRGVQATGLSAIVTERHAGALCGTGAIRLRLSSADLDSQFVSFWLSAERSIEWIKAHAVGGVMPNVNESVLRLLPIEFPEIGEQCAIATFLGAIDEKINLNSEMNLKLERLANALFRSWFVDFDPVVAKRDGTIPVGVPAEAIALFPSHFEESEVGPIPQGWRAVPLDSVADFLNGLALQRYPPRVADELPVIKIAELRAGTNVGADRCGGVPSEYVIDDGDVVFSWSGSLMVDVWCGGKGALNQHLFKVTSSDVPKWFYLAWLNEHLPEFQAIAADKATTMGHIRRFHLTEAKVLLPPEPLMKAMTSVQQPLLDQIIHNRLESRTLAELRDTLLGPLLSGELTIKSAENTVGAAL
jgi:type I restriction enzyme S subunit